MATLTPPAHAPSHETEMHEQEPAPSVASAAGDMTLNHQVNGHASEHNSAAAATATNSAPSDDQILSRSDNLPSKPLHLSSPQPSIVPSESAPHTVTQIETASTPSGNTVVEMSSTTTAATDPPVPVAPPAPIADITTSHEAEIDPTSASAAIPTSIDHPSNIGQPVLSDERSTVIEEVRSSQEGTSGTPEVQETKTVTTEISQPDPADPTQTTQVTEIVEVQAPPTAPESEPTLKPAEEVPVIEHTKSELKTPETLTPKAEIVESEMTTETIIPQTQPNTVQSSDEVAKPALETSLQAPPTPPQQIVDQSMPDAKPDSGKIAREREDDDDDDAEAPDAKRARIDEHNDTVVADEAMHDGKIKLNTAIVPPQVTEDTIMAEPTEISTPGGSTTVVNNPVEAAAEGAVAGDNIDAVAEAAGKDWGPLTDAQSKVLKTILQNLKKGKHATFFSKPVDPVALKIPTYHDIIKEPMDLSTMDKKVKEGSYSSVNAFISDFQLIVDNAVKFNGPTHAVSQAANNMKAQFGAALRRIPQAGEEAPPPPPKPRPSSFTMPAREAKRRVSRPSLGGNASSPTAAAAAANPPFAVGQDGIPLARRTSTHDGRPKREIHKPPPRDLPYLSAKPKKKKYQMELKFCEFILGELKRGRYAEWMTPFSHPVDPVALNIPEYHKYVKKPMDFQTISEKLQNGQYENAKEFEADVKLVFTNCYKFNGQDHPISQGGKALEAAFDEMWKTKQGWIQQNLPASAPQSPAAESDSEEEGEDEEEEDEDEEDGNAEMEKAAEIASLNQKIAELSAQVMGLVHSKPAKKPKTGKKKVEKPAKKGSASGPKRKSSGVAAAGASSAKQDKKSKPKSKPKPVTLKEKSEIAERIGELSLEDTAKAAELIKAGLRKMGRTDLADRPDEELEFDIDSIPDDVLQSLLKLVRKNDDKKENKSAVPAAKSSAPSKPKKNKPMGKYEQEDAIRRLTERIDTFSNSAAGQADTAQDVAVSSGDDSESGSESEEE